MDAASGDVSRQGWSEALGVAEALGPPGTRLGTEGEVSLDEVLALAQSLADGLTHVRGPESAGHTLRLARALSREIVELIQDARAH